MSPASTEQHSNCARSAAIAHKFTVVRSHTHTDNGHATGYHYVMTGRRAPFPDGEYPVPTNEHFPSLGSIVARELGLPAIVGIRDLTKRVTDGQQVEMDGSAGTIRLDA